MFRQRRLHRKPRRRRGEAIAAPVNGLQRQQLHGVLYRIQRKLSVGPANDPQEHEADAVADQVMRMPQPQASVSLAGQSQLQRQCADCAEEDMQRRPLAETLQRQAPEEDKDDALQTQRLQRQSAPQEDEQEEELQAKAETASGAEGGPVGADIASRISQRQGAGQALPSSERSFFEPRFGADFSAVRVHTDPEAQQISRAVGARAFTLGNDIYFGAGEYRPGEGGGRHLMAHELTHTLQQSGSRDGEVRRKVSSITVGTKKVVLKLELALTGSNASAALATKWENAIENHWKVNGTLGGKPYSFEIDATVKAYPALNKVQGLYGAPEDNVVHVVAAGQRSFVAGSCGLMRPSYSCGEWAVDDQTIVTAHEAGHLMGLDDKYIDIFGQSMDLPGYSRDIMANFWNDNGNTDYTRAWSRIIVNYAWEKVTGG